MNSDIVIAPLFENVVRKADFLKLLTDAANAGFISIEFALAVTSSLPAKTRLVVSPELRSAAGLRDWMSKSRDALASARSVKLSHKTEAWIEAELNRMENSHEL